MAVPFYPVRSKGESVATPEWVCFLGSLRSVGRLRPALAPVWLFAWSASPAGVAGCASRLVAMAKSTFAWDRTAGDLFVGLSASWIRRPACDILLCGLCVLFFYRLSA